MSYLALARKWRPRSFSQFLGQDQVSQVLSYALDENRLHHAYLFTGTRGVGKTSVARLLAKAMNCEQGISSNPCLACETCRMIEQGQFIDLIEVDGASRARVEEVRDLLDNVQYLPTQGRFKIYLIDEVHMLSQHSFNALLKTLEEPPLHVKFLLATTDPQKLPITVLSRCLQLHLKPLTEALISSHLQTILEEENIGFEPAALVLLGRAAKGSLRDGLSLLDQAIASSQGFLSQKAIKLSLGYTQKDYAFLLLKALARLDAKRLLELSAAIAAEGGNFYYVLDEILHYFHRLLLSQYIKIPSQNEREGQAVEALAKQFKPEDLQLFFQIGTKAVEELHLAPTLALGFEMMLLRMLVFRPLPERQSLPPLAYENLSEAPKNNKDKVLGLALPEAKLVPIEKRQNEEVNKAGASGPLGLEQRIAPVHSEPPFTQLNKEQTGGRPSREAIQVERIKPEQLNTKPINSPASKSKGGETPTFSQKKSEELLSPDDTALAQSWGRLLKALPLQGLAENLLRNAECLGKSGQTIKLRVARNHLSLFSKKITERIEQVLSDYYQAAIRVNLVLSDHPLKDSPQEQEQKAQERVLQQAEVALQADAFFQEMKEDFSASLSHYSFLPEALASEKEKT